MGWLAENHLVLMFFLLGLAALLDLGVTHADSRLKNPRGLAVRFLCCCYLGQPSSRKLKKACWEAPMVRDRLVLATVIAPVALGATVSHDAWWIFLRIKPKVLPTEAI